MLQKAKELAFNKWKRTLQYLRTSKKCKDYGFNETQDTHWDKLPKASQEYWLLKST
jgi:hypothetical protein